MDTSLLPGLVAFALVSSITPGPNNLMLMASGTNFGFARTLPHLAGVNLGFMALFFAVGAGVGALVMAVPGSGLVLSIAGGAYLPLLAWRIATAPPPAPGIGKGGGRPLGFVQAILFQWVNPKSWTMALTGVTAYVPASDPVSGLIVAGLVFGAVNLPSVTAWALMGVQLRRLLGRPGALRAFNVTAALLLVASLYPMMLAATAFGAKG